ncbi:hypothetical protein M436DRAFT_81786 [Aureobasidium namibiae CBS 147.97]|uniref:Uncharacterized protein n=1 Tax=Aureobasidium namibiae CBS 147.97 TaxID=1043004 RepID=A0A074XFL7_9PEZI
MGPLLQSPKDARDSSGLTAPPAPSAVIQALENARDYRPLAAGNTPLTAGDTPLAANTAGTPALAPASPAGDTRTPAIASAPLAAETPHPSQDETPQDIPQDDIAESSHASQDDVPVLDFETGTKRKRRIDSSDAGSSQEVPAEDEESHSEHESFPLLTSGAAPTPTQRTLAASTKAINRRTANDLAGVPSGKVFACPVANCNASITESWSIQQFYKHMEDGTHTAYFYHARSHQCPFGCHEGFFNDFALHRHIQKQLCEQADALLADIKKCKQCNDRSGMTPDIIGALNHLDDDHSDLLSISDSPYAVNSAQSLLVPDPVNCSHGDTQTEVGGIETHSSF